MVSLIVSGVTLAGCLLALALLHRGPGLTEKERDPLKWGDKEELRGIAGNHTQVAGMLAGFAITIVVLIAGATMTPASVPVEADKDVVFTMGMFMLAFLGYVSAAVLYSVVTERDKSTSNFLFSGASGLYYVSVVLSFSALVPLTGLIHMKVLGPMVATMVLGAVIGGHLAAYIPLADLLLLRRRVWPVILLIPPSLAFLIIGINERLGGVIQASLASSRIFSVAVVIITGAFAFCMIVFFVAPTKDKEPKWYLQSLALAATIIVTVLTTMAVCLALMALELAGILPTF